MSIKLKLDNNSQTPVYKQIMENIEKAIKSGKSAAGDMLPSMNELAAELEVSKETVKKPIFSFATRE